MLARAGAGRTSGANSNGAKRRSAPVRSVVPQGSRSRTIVQPSRTPHIERASLAHPAAGPMRQWSASLSAETTLLSARAGIVLALLRFSAISRLTKTLKRHESNVTTFLKTWLAHVMSVPPISPAESALGILIVDDEVSACLYADHVLRRAGYLPVTASSGAEAVRKAGAMARVDVLVTNLMMPGMNGDEIAGVLRQRDADVKVLYVAGFSDRLAAEKDALRDGGPFLEKPYSMSGHEQALSLLAYGRLDRPARETAAPASAPALWM
jgi:CheY-like chemotaxis protein